MSDRIPFPEDSAWPRRLLHVDTLTSYEWQPGNMYGGYRSPRYNAISYTWGRFVIKGDDAHPGITPMPMPIKGTTWEEYLPRINPQVFTNAELVHATKTAACPWPEYNRVDFIWLDVACINQTPGSVENAGEVGRQAKIFKGAGDVFIWLYSFDCESFLKVSEEMTAAMMMSTDDPNRYPRLIAVFETFEKDPWFSSLWTLQEAFLSPQAIFLWRDGFTERFLQLARLEGPVVSYQPFTLKLWVDAWRFFGAEQPEHKESAILASKIWNLGFMDAVLDADEDMLTGGGDAQYPRGVMGNPFGLLVASKHRTTTYEEDRIYAIMQVFDLKLGKSAEGAADRSFSFEELNEQLAAALLEKYPLISQLIKQDKDCKERRAWMLTPSVSLTQTTYDAWDHLALGGRADIVASLRAERYAGYLRASFSGPVTSLEAWWRSVSTQQSFCSGRYKIMLDTRWQDHLEYSTGSKLIARRRGLGMNERQISTMIECFQRPKILFLGYLSRADTVPPESDLYCHMMHTAFGLMLREEQQEPRRTYSRIGILSWDLDAAEDRQGHVYPHHPDFEEYLCGRGEGWDWEDDGLFG
ncbi:hypothetical protein BJX61DRAFT_544921 [Aspergillus egyptiacus]|nr:hypothetical protein BJX61DRAFT_544921 [Aspergillus egyptiacus]